MANRFVDTAKVKKKFWRELSLEAKAFWDYITLECDHAGVWEVEFETAQNRILRESDRRAGKRLDFVALRAEFGDRVKIIDSGKKWFVPSFVEFQYKLEKFSDLDPKNRVHFSVIQILRKQGIWDLLPPPVAPVPLFPKAPSRISEAPYVGGKDKDKDKVKDKDKDKDPDFITPEEAAANAAMIAEIARALSGKPDPEASGVA